MLRFACCVLISSLIFAACGQNEGGTGSGHGTAAGRTKVAFLANCVDPFWDLAIAGAQHAADELDVELIDYCPPTGGLDEQERKLEDLLAQGVDGVAVTPIDGINMVPLLNRVAAAAPLVTHDSDAPASERLCFIGCDNYAAGLAVGELVKEALPEGGQVMLFIGRLEQDNAQKRRQGVIDSLLGREPDDSRRDPDDGVIEGGGYSILGTVTDGMDATQAQAGAEDALSRYADLDCMVGLFAYNPPACLEAVRSAERLDQVAIVGFDEHRATVDGIRSGAIHGTVTQDPYAYGEQSVRILAAVIAGDRSVLPEDKRVRIEHRTWRKDNIDELGAMLDQYVGTDR